MSMFQAHGKLGTKREREREGALPLSRGFQRFTYLCYLAPISCLGRALLLLWGASRVKTRERKSAGGRRRPIPVPCPMTLSGHGFFAKAWLATGQTTTEKNPERAQEAVKPDMRSVAWCRGSSELSMLHFHAASAAQKRRTVRGYAQRNRLAKASSSAASRSDSTPACANVDGYSAARRDKVEPTTWTCFLPDKKKSTNRVCRCSVARGDGPRMPRR